LSRTSYQAQWDIVAGWSISLYKLRILAENKTFQGYTVCITVSV